MNGEVDGARLEAISQLGSGAYYTDGDTLVVAQPLPARHGRG